MLDDRCCFPALPPSHQPSTNYANGTRGAASIYIVTFVLAKIGLPSTPTSGMLINEESNHGRDAAERLKAQGNELHQKGRY